jgi:lipid-binding SYLF domain-containing protein
MPTTRRNASIVALALALSGCVSVDRAPQVFPPAHYLVNDAIISLGALDLQQFPPMEKSLREGCAVLIFPGVTNAGFLVGGAHGRGIVMTRDVLTGLWHGPVFLSLSEIDVGPHVVAGKRDIVVAVRSCDPLNPLLVRGASMRFGMLLEAQAGEEGAAREASGGGVAIHSRMRGVNVGAALNATMLSVDRELARSFYGVALDASEILGRDRSDDPLAAEIRAAVGLATRRSP